MESNALRRITTAVGNSLDITDLENQLDFWLDEIDTVDWITEGEIYVLGHYDDEERGFTLRIELDGEN